MDKINVSEKILDTNYKFRGYESKLYLHDGILYKIFDQYIINDEILKNKRKKIEILNTMDFLSKPMDLIYINNKFRGYTINYLSEYTSLNNLKTSKKQKIKLLKLLKEEILSLHKKEIIFGDLNATNIISNGHDIHFCDLDNIKIKSFDFDIKSVNQAHYLKHFDTTEHLDYYMYNILLISIINKIASYYVIYNLKKYNLPHILKTHENYEIKDAMITLNNYMQIKPFTIK